MADWAPPAGGEDATRAADRPPRGGGRLRRVLRKSLLVPTVGTLLALVLGAVGQLVRDRNVLLALMMYVPLPLVGAWAVVFDLLRRGRSVRRFRFGLSGAGLVALVAGGLPMVGMRRPDPAPADATPVTLLHWNVMWGDAARWHETAQ